MSVKYPNVLYTTLLAACLVIPFALRLRFTEPYPAVLLPSGAGTIKTAADKIDCNRTAIYGKLPGRDAWIRLSPWQFLYPIPVEFFPPLAERYFGLIPGAHRILKIGVITIDQQPKVTEDDVKSGKQWFRTRLSENGYDSDVLRITQEVVTFRRSDGEQMAVQYQDEKLLDLR
jgi:hypothetical protein